MNGNMPELLSPCGGLESFDAALSCCGEAVYSGGISVSASINSVNFSRVVLALCVRECHRNGVLVYQAVNTVAFDEELDALAEELEFACSVGVDALIVQDLAVRAMVRRACPSMPLHASTQMSVHSPEGVLALKELGYERTVVAREMPLDTLKEVCALGTEIEAFVHGALCMCLSGQCYLSAMIGSRSANRGGCAGACRLPFSAKGKSSDKYALSLKDLSYAEHIDGLKEAGVASLKIEGRMKRPEYVAAATSTLRAALDGKDYDMDTLRAVFSRSGFTDGYLVGKLDRSMFGARTKEDVISANDVLPKLRELYRAPMKRFDLDISFSALDGEQMKLTASDGISSVTVYGDIPERAHSRATVADAVEKQLSKLGGTLYNCGKLQVTLDDGLMIPLSKINELRRETIALLDEMRINRLTVIKPFDRSALPKVRKGKKKPQTALRIYVESLEQLDDIHLTDFEYVMIPLGEVENCLLPKDKVILTLPRYVKNEHTLRSQLEAARILGYTHALCSNIAHIRLAKELGFTLHGGFGLNIANSLAAGEYAEMGLCDMTLSYELKASQLSAVDARVPTGYIAYGQLPLMLLVNCPIRGEVGCKNCKGTLTDRTGTVFKVSCHREQGYYELLNSATLHTEDKKQDFNADFAVLYFTDESAEQVANTVENYKASRKPQGDLTRGLYYRGIE